jgi:hypothetical protein
MRSASAISARAAHVPFRNSRLTHLLQPCLSGGGKALVLMALSPAAVKRPSHSRARGVGGGL